MLKETFMTNRDINDREVQQLSENVTVLDKDVNALKEAVQQMNETLQKGDFAKKISEEQKERDHNSIKETMAYSASFIKLSSPTAKIPESFEAILKELLQGLRRYMHQSIFPAEPKKWMWRLLLACFCLNLCFGGYVLYQYRWSPYAWGIRAHEAATELNVKGHERAFDYVVSGIRRGNKKERKGLVLDWEREIKKNH